MEFPDSLQFFFCLECNVNHITFTLCLFLSLESACKLKGIVPIKNNVINVTLLAIINIILLVGH